MSSSLLVYLQQAVLQSWVCLCVGLLQFLLLALEAAWLNYMWPASDIVVVASCCWCTLLNCCEQGPFCPPSELLSAAPAEPFLPSELIESHLR